MSVMETTFPVDNLVRAVYPGVDLKRSVSEKDGTLATLFGHLAIFNQWSEIDSVIEGHFMERFAPGCLTKTINENRDRIQVLFDHGEDPSIGKKVLGPITVLREDGEGGYYEVTLIDTSYNRDLLAGLKAGLYGSSMRFKVIKEDLAFRPKPSAYNPKGLPERTVTEARIVEFGPVPFPVYAGATSGVRSMTDQFHDRKPKPARTTSESHDFLYKRSVDFVGNHPWIIHPAMMETLVEIVSERANGHRPTEQEIKERIGTRSTPEPTTEGGPIAVINVTGTIMPHATLMSQMSGGGSIEDFQQQLRAALENPDVKEIVLNIDSPGGAVAMVPEFGAEVLAAREVKPITAVANTMAASAAYWIASAASSISVTPSGEVGSIGVITAHQDVSAALDKQGVKTTVVTAGKYKGELSPFQPLSDDAKSRLQEEVDAYYGMFVDAVAAGRGDTAANVKENYGQGRMLMAKDAVKAGMADRVESFDQAMTRLSKKYRPKMSTTTMTASENADYYVQTFGQPNGTASSGTIIITGDVFAPKRSASEVIADAVDTEFPSGDKAGVHANLERDLTDFNERTTEESGTVDNALVDSGAGNSHSSATSREVQVEIVSTKTEEYEKMRAGMTIEEVRARLTEIEARQREVAAEFGTDPFTEAVAGEWNEMLKERPELLQRIKDYDARQEVLREVHQDDDRGESEISTALRLSNGNNQPVRRRNNGVPENIYAIEEYRNLSRNENDLSKALRDGAMRAIELSHFPHPEANREDQQTRVERLLDTSDDEQRSLARRILVTGSPTYQRAFTKYIGGAGLTSEEQRSLSLTGSAGGFAVPIVIDPTVILTSNSVVNPIRALARTETIVGNTWTGVSTAGVTAVYTAEATETTDGAPTLAQPTANVEKAQAFIPFSIEIGEDWGALQSEMARLLQDAKDTLESNKFLTGAGHASNVPEGLLVGATVVVTSAATATFAVADVYSLETALAPRWRPRASIVANRAQFNKVRQFDTAGGASLWVQLQVAAPPTLIGYNAYEWSDMSAAGTSAASIMTIGDFSQFLILDRIGMNIELIPLLLNVGNNRPDGTRGLYAYWRNTSKVLTNAAFRTLKLL